MRGINDLSFHQSDKTREWRWKLSSGTNGKVIASSSESFKRLKKCVENFVLFRKSKVSWSTTYAKGARRISSLNIQQMLDPVLPPEKLPWEEK